MNRGPTKVYRHYDKHGGLLYVGCSTNVLSRTYKHENGSHWFCDVINITVAHYETRLEALDAERSAIRNEKPKFNIKSTDKQNHA